jgi:hypothetical protein
MVRFIEAYKHLEKLCGEVMNDDRRIGAYIDEMRNNPKGAFYVPGWEEDLKRLKHCRWVRNQIAHNPDCTEENMCEPDDALWLDQFRARIMEQTDPLAMYRKATQPCSASVSNKQQSYPERETPNNNAQSSGAGCLTWLIAILLMILLIGGFLFS